MNISVVEGWTGDLNFQLLADGAAYNLTGTTVTLVLLDSNGATIDTTGDLSVTDAVLGKVRYSPDAGDFRASVSSYSARVKVALGSQVIFFPSGAPGIWTINK